MRHCAFKKFGKGTETILFFPAAGFSGMEGEMIADFFQEDYQFYLCNSPGYGESSGFDRSIKPRAIADWVINFLDEEKKDQVHLIGHSAGGFVCLCSASYEGINQKRAQFEQKNSAAFTAQSNCDIVKVPGAHYVLWAKEFPLSKLRAFITNASSR